MAHLKIHYMIHELGNSEAQEVWKNEGLIPNKVKFCDGLMMSRDRWLDFTKNIDHVDCKKCQKKIDTWWKNGFDLPY